MIIVIDFLLAKGSKVSYDFLSKLPAHLNISRTGGGGGSHSGGGNRPSAAAVAAAPVTVINTSKPGLTISKMEEGVDPLSDEQDPLVSSVYYVDKDPVLLNKKTLWNQLTRFISMS